MAITIDWEAKVISVPKSDMTLVQSNPTEIRQLDMDIFRLTLKDLEDDVDGMIFPDAHAHTAPISVGGVSLARVVEIVNGYTVTFEDGQYAVNLVGANTNLGDVINLNQVSVRSSNSAGLVNVDEFKLQSFQNARVWLNTNNGVAGTSFPNGTPSNPVDNPTDALFIANQNDLERFHISGQITLPNGEEFAGSDWEGHSIVSSAINLNNVSVNNSYFKNIEISGQCDGFIDLEDCKVTTVTNFRGVIQNSSIDNLTINSTNTDLVHISKCVSHGPTTIIDANSANCNILIRDFFGELDIRNVDQGNTVNIGISGGKVHLKNTCTNGTIVINGLCDLVDESGAGCTVETAGKITIKPFTKGQFIALQ